MRVSRLLFLATALAVPGMRVAFAAAPQIEVEKSTTCAVINRQAINSVGRDSVADIIQAAPGTAPNGSSCPQPLDTFNRRILDIHNHERSLVGAAPLRWNPVLAQHASDAAQVLAHTGELVHAPREGRGIERENLEKGLIGWGPDQFMQDWRIEARLFRDGLFPNICDGGWSRCAHYSQMIWPTTTDIGCGRAQGQGFDWFVCRYSPGGNKDGKPVGRAPQVATNNAKADGAPVGAINTDPFVRGGYHAQLSGHFIFAGDMPPTPDSHDVSGPSTTANQRLFIGLHSGLLLGHSDNVVIQQSLPPGAPPDGDFIKDLNLEVSLQPM